MSDAAVERLVYMANQIARNLALDDEPVAAIAAHIKAFWSPRMMAQILAAIDQAALEPTAKQALSLLAK